MFDLTTHLENLTEGAATSVSRQVVTAAIGDEKGKCLAVSWLKNSLELAFL